MLINGEPSFSAEAAPGEVVRLYVVNTANTRIFNLAIAGARAKLVGSDSGRYERETFVDEVLLSPSERAVIDVLFDAPGPVKLEHRTPEHTYDLGGFTVTGDRVEGAASTFETLRVDPDLTAVHQAIEPDLERPPDKVLAFFSKMPLLYGGGAAEFLRLSDASGGDVHRARDMSEVRHEAHRCRTSGTDVLRLSHASRGHRDRAGHLSRVRDEARPVGNTCSDHRPHEMEHGHHDGGDGLEWEDLMPDINRASDAGNMIWQLIDRETGAENGAISWSFTVGDRVKIRLVNEMESDHPMHHPFHIHGAGRFLILARDDEPEANLVWKDTVLVRAGETVDILLDVSNPGLWMAHCHIAEHNQSGMMFSFNVARRPDASRP